MKTSRMDEVIHDCATHKWTFYKDTGRLDAMVIALTSSPQLGSKDESSND
jgi:hypothetical protein